MRLWWDMEIRILSSSWVWCDLELNKMPYPIKHEHFNDNYAKIFPFLFSLSFSFALWTYNSFLIQLSTDWLMTTLRCVCNLVCVSVQQKPARTCCAFTRKRMKKPNWEMRTWFPVCLGVCFFIFRASLAWFEWQGGWDLEEHLSYQTNRLTLPLHSSFH